MEAGRVAAMRAIFAVAMVHLVVAALFSTHALAERMLPAGLARVLGVYGELTGARTHFDFFAPDVAPQARGYVLLTGPGGAVTRVALESSSGEVNHRLATMMSYLGDARARAFVMHSWCVHFLSADPRLLAAEARLEIIEVPTMAEARAGARARWHPLDRYVLARDKAS
jgi:hypothetical protein